MERTAQSSMRPPGYPPVMDELTLQCPYCFETVEVAFERDLEGQLVQDCEVCCRPWSVWIRRDSDGTPTVTVDRAQ